MGDARERGEEKRTDAGSGAGAALCIYTGARLLDQPSPNNQQHRASHSRPVLSFRDGGMLPVWRFSSTVATSSLSASRRCAHHHRHLAFTMNDTMYAVLILVTCHCHLQSLTRWDFRLKDRVAGSRSGTCLSPFVPVFLWCLAGMISIVVISQW